MSNTILSREEYNEMLKDALKPVCSKMSRDENVTTDVLGKVCAALDCKVEDIIDFLPDEEN